MKSFWRRFSSNFAIHGKLTDLSLLRVYTVPNLLKFSYSKLEKKKKKKALHSIIWKLVSKSSSLHSSFLLSCTLRAYEPMRFLCKPRVMASAGDNEGGQQRRTLE